MKKLQPLADCLGFETFGDPQLENLLAHVNNLLVDAKGGEFRWLAMLGTTGVGKTHLARRLLPMLRTILKAHLPEFSSPSAVFVCWPDMVSRMRAGEFGLVQDLIDADIVALDEIGGEVASEFSAGALYRLLNGRLGKITVLTGNLSLKALGAQDARVASRLIRPPNQAVTVQTVDYALRAHIGS